MIQAEGVESLSEAELRAACRERGMLGMRDVESMQNMVRAKQSQSALCCRLHSTLLPPLHCFEHEGCRTLYEPNRERCAVLCHAGVVWFLGFLLTMGAAG